MTEAFILILGGSLAAKIVTRLEKEMKIYRKGNKPVISQILLKIRV